jgi:hypothetical protein
LRQVHSLWDLLVARDVRYGDVATSAAESEAVAGQHVRLIEETVNNSQVNCVDGSVLPVSLLRKIGVDAFLVLEPRHCDVGFYADPDHKRRYALETTLLGEALTEDDVKPAKFIHRAIGEELRDEASYYSFAEALRTAAKKLDETFPKRRDHDQTKYRLIDIAAARQDGVLPIPFQGKVEFVAYEESDEEETEEDDSEEEEDEEEEAN